MVKRERQRHYTVIHSHCYKSEETKHKCCYEAVADYFYDPSVALVCKKKKRNWPWTSLLLVWMADFWVNNSPSGQFLASPHSPYRVPPNNNHMLLASRGDCSAVSLCLCVHVCELMCKGTWRQGSEEGGELAKPRWVRCEEGVGCLCVEFVSHHHMLGDQACLV